MNEILNSLSTADLNADLATKTYSELIELCLLAQTNIFLAPDFATRLKAEIERRYNRDNFKSGEYAVLVSFYQKLENPLNSKQQKLLEMYDSVNRELWHRANNNFINDAFSDPLLIAWLCEAEQSNILSTILNTSTLSRSASESEAFVLQILNSESAWGTLKNNNRWFLEWRNSSVAMLFFIQDSNTIDFLINYHHLDNILESATARNVLCQSDEFCRKLVAKQQFNNLNSWNNTFIELLKIEKFNKEIFSNPNYRNIIFNKSNLSASLWHASIRPFVFKYAGTEILRFKPAYNSLFNNIDALNEFAQTEALKTALFNNLDILIYLLDITIKTNNSKYREFFYANNSLLQAKASQLIPKIQANFTEAGVLSDGKPPQAGSFTRTSNHLYVVELGTNSLKRSIYHANHVLVNSTNEGKFICFEQSSFTYVMDSLNMTIKIKKYRSKS